MITLGTARPTPEFIPWKSIVMHGVQDSFKDDIDAARSSSSMSCAKVEAVYDLSIALNYGYAGGSPQVLRFITEHVEMIQKPP